MPRVIRANCPFQRHCGDVDLAKRRWNRFGCSSFRHGEPVSWPKRRSQLLVYRQDCGLLHGTLLRLSRYSHASARRAGCECEDTWNIGGQRWTGRPPKHLQNRRSPARLQRGHPIAGQLAPCAAVALADLYRCDFGIQAIGGMENEGRLDFVHGVYECVRWLRG
jgi:hypothetical protein